MLIVNSDPLLSVALENATSQDDLVVQTSISDIDEDVTEVSTITWFRNGFREAHLMVQQLLHRHTLARTRVEC